MSSKLRSEDRVVPITQRERPAYRVLIAERDSMASDLMASALGRDGRYEAIAVQPADLMHSLIAGEVDVLVMGADISLESGSAFDLVRSLCHTHPNVSIVVLLSQVTNEAVISAFRYGARGVFSRQRPMTEFLDCIEHVGKGFIWAGRQESRALIEAIRSIPVSTTLIGKDSLPLTARELQTVQCAARGKTNKSIARELGLSEHTVKNYLFRAFEKLGVSSRVELLLYLTVRGHKFDPVEPDAVAPLAPNA